MLAFSVSAQFTGQRQLERLVERRRSDQLESFSILIPLQLRTYVLDPVSTNTHVG